MQNKDETRGRKPAIREADAVASYLELGSFRRVGERHGVDDKTAKAAFARAGVTIGPYPTAMQDQVDEGLRHVLAKFKDPAA